MAKKKKKVERKKFKKGKKVSEINKCKLTTIGEVVFKPIILFEKYKDSIGRKRTRVAKEFNPRKHYLVYGFSQTKLTDEIEAIRKGKGEKKKKSKKRTRIFPYEPVLDIGGKKFSLQKEFGAPREAIPARLSRGLLDILQEEYRAGMPYTEKTFCEFFVDRTKPVKDSIESGVDFRALSKIVNRAGWMTILPHVYFKRTGDRQERKMIGYQAAYRTYDGDKIRKHILAGILDAVMKNKWTFSGKNRQQSKALRYRQKYQRVERPRVILEITYRDYKLTPPREKKKATRKKATRKKATRKKKR